MTYTTLLTVAVRAPMRQAGMVVSYIQLSVAAAVALGSPGCCGVSSCGAVRSAAPHPSVSRPANPRIEYRGKFIVTSADRVARLTERAARTPGSYLGTR